MRRTLPLVLLLLACNRAPAAETPATTHNVPPPPPPAQTAAVPDLPPAATPSALPLAKTGDAPAPGHPAVDAKPMTIGTFPPADRTIADLRAQRAKLVGQAVAVRGRVVKVNHDILNNNWLHLRDASTENDKTELVVTTHGDAQRGELVRVRGTVAIDRDMGAGFRYDVLLEDAMVVHESPAVDAAAEVTPK